MDIFQNIALGFNVCLQPINILYAFVGALVGTLVGVLPGLGPSATISLLLPMSFHIPPVGAIIMLSGIYYGAMYGGSTTSILVNIPGEAASVVTCFDGYQMARQGRAGAALGISAMGSFIGGTLGIVAMMFVAPPLARAALKFGPPEYTTMMILGLVVTTFLVRGSMAKALTMAAFGLFLSAIGLDPISGAPRLTLGIVALMDGIGLVPVIMGLYGVSEVLINLEQTLGREVFRTSTKGLFPNKQEWHRSTKPILRGSLLGFLLGILPGGGAILASFMSYAIEKKVSKHPEKFGTGMIEGVAGPETANNAASQGAFIPLLTLGIPCNSVMAILMGGLMIQGIQPGPILMRAHPDLFWGVICSMYLGNIMLLVLNLPLIGMWVQILRVPYKFLYPLIFLLCIIGCYSFANSTSDVLVMIIFGIVGYLMRKTDYEMAPLVLALVLGNLLENALRQSLIIGRGSFVIFFLRPISFAFLLAAIVFLILPIIPWVKRRKVRIELESSN
jgi:putative tricarboxylic transport membrane protein